MPSASYPASSRVASLTRTCCVVARGESSGEEGEGKGRGVGCNRLVTSIGELTLGPFPCQ